MVGTIAIGKVEAKGETQEFGLSSSSGFGPTPPPLLLIEIADAPTPRVNKPPGGGGVPPKIFRGPVGADDEVDPNIALLVDSPLASSFSSLAIGKGKLPLARAL